MNTPALNQGKRFKTYQNKMNITKEGFQMQIPNLSNNGLTTQTKNVLKSTNISPNQQQENQNLTQNYDNTLNQYQNEHNVINTKTNEYLARVNPQKNPYLNNVIRTTNGTDLYVTNMGVAKFIPNGNVLNYIQSIYPNIKIMQLNFPSQDSWGSPGATIPTTPTLITGTPVVSGQTLGNEGNNIYVNSLINNPQPSYLGCFADNVTTPLMTFIGGAPPPPNLIINGNFSQPALPSNTYINISYNVIDYSSSGSPTGGSANVNGWIVNGGYLLNGNIDNILPTPFPSGSQCMLIQYTEAIQQLVALNSGVEYTLSFWACCLAGYSTNGLGIALLNGGSQTVLTIDDTITPSYSWEQYSVTFTSPNSGNYYIYFYGDAQGNDQSSVSFYAIQGISLSTASSNDGTYSYDQCQQAAIDGEYQYFALQNVNTQTALGYCAVGNNQISITSLGNAYIPSEQNVLWSSNTSQSGSIAILNVSGSLSVTNNGTSIFSTPNNSAAPSNYIGCYGDSSVRAMTLYNGGSQQYDLTSCQQIAANNNASLFGLQNSSSGTTAQCALSSDLGQATEYGTANNCTQISGGSWSGGGWSNAVYYTTTPTPSYFIILQDDGNMCIYLGSGPNDQQGGAIWCSGTNGQLQDANPAYAAANGIYGQNWMPVGSTLAAGDFLGSTSGNMALIMQGTGNLELCTFAMVSNCSTMSDGNIGGGVAANAIYNIGEVAVASNMGNLGYIDEDSNVHKYSNNTQYTNNYSTSSNVGSNLTEISNASFGNATEKSCKSACNNISNCVAINFSDGECIPLSAISEGFSNLEGYTGQIYTKNTTPLTAPLGAKNNTVNTDSVTFNNYSNGGNFSPAYGLIQAIEPQQQKMNVIQNKLDVAASGISHVTNNYSAGVHKLEKQAKKNVIGLKKYISELKQTDNAIYNITSGSLENILTNSDIVVLQKNYNYLLWSILAIGTIIVAINVSKK